MRGQLLGNKITGKVGEKMVNGRKIKELREEMGLNTYEFSIKVGASQSMISFVERGIKSPGVELLSRIADVFGCSLDELVEREADTG